MEAFSKNMKMPTLCASCHRIAVSLITFCVILNSVKAQDLSESVQDILDNLQTVVGLAQDFIGDPTGCRFSCDNGVEPEPNPRHKASSNGCGAFGIKLDSEITVKAVTACCDEHDICYDTCLKSKKLCDNVFKECLEDVCRRTQKMVSDQIYQACQAAADLMYTGTLALGCKAYKDAQKNACICQRRITEL